jgi:hypothetical protein
MMQKQFAHTTDLGDAARAALLLSIIMLLVVVLAFKQL